MIRHTKALCIFFVLTLSNNCALSSEESWYQIQTLGCLLPIPTEMILKTGVKPYFFYSGKQFNIDKLLRISIEDYNEETFKNEKFQFSNLESSGWLELISAKYNGALIAYTITNKVQTVTVSKDIGSDNIKYMYNECLKSKLPKITISDEEYEALKKKAD